MDRDELTALGESLRDDFLLSIGEENYILAALEQEMLGLWETIDHQFETLAAWLTSTTAADALPDFSAPLAADDGSAAEAQRVDRHTSSPTAAPPAPTPRAILSDAGKDPHPAPPTSPAAPAAPPGSHADSVSDEPVTRQRAAARAALTPRPPLPPSRRERQQASAPFRSQQSSSDASPVPREAGSRPDASITPPSPRFVPVDADEEINQPDISTTVQPTADDRTISAWAMESEEREPESKPETPAAYRPVKGLQDLAQFLSAGPYREEESIPPAAENPSAPLASTTAPQTKPETRPPVLVWNQDYVWETAPADDEDNGGESTVISQRAESAPPVEPDMESILEALSRSLMEEYKRYYRS
jgi:hypothetical protein